jgi:hypothetical protein
MVPSRLFPATMWKAQTNEVSEGRRQPLENLETLSKILHKSSRSRFSTIANSDGTLPPPPIASSAKPKNIFHRAIESKDESWHSQRKAHRKATVVYLHAPKTIMVTLLFS